MDVTKEAYRFFIETMRRNGKSAAEIHNQLSTAWHDKAPSQATVYRVFNDLASGARTSLSDAPHSGRPKSACIPEKIEEVEKLIAINPRITIEEIGEEASISHGSAYTIVTVYLQLTCRCSRWVPHSLCPEQKLQRVEAAHDWLGVFQNMDERELMQRIVVIDEKYFYHRSLGNKQSNRSWCLGDEERQRVPRRTMNDTKSHVICATSFCGRYHFAVLDKRTVNSDVYIAFLTEMHHKFVHERNSLGWSRMLLIHDNARPHTSNKTRDFLTSRGVQLLKQPPYSPDFNLCDRWLFGMLERKRNRCNFNSAHDLEVFLHGALTGIEKGDHERQLGHLKNDLTAVIDAAGDYL